MRAQLFMADGAQIDPAGKVHAIGIGWTICPPGPQVIRSLVALVAVPWPDANRKFTVEIDLIDGNGMPALLRGLPDNRLHIEREYEVGRPPGLKPGSDLVMPIVSTFANLDLQPNETYQFRLTIDGERNADWRATFATTGVAA